MVEIQFGALDSVLGPSVVSICLNYFLEWQPNHFIYCSLKLNLIIVVLNPSNISDKLALDTPSRSREISKLGEGYYTNHISHGDEIVQLVEQLLLDQ